MASRTPPPIKVAISGAGGNIGYALLPLLASGSVFGRNQPIELRLLEIPRAIPSLVGTRMELLDCAFPCLASDAVMCTTDPLAAFADAHVIVLVGGRPRSKGMARKDLIQANTSIFTAMGKAINEVASPSVKVMVVANPANTNCLVALNEATRIPSKNFCALTYLDHQRARGQIARRLGVPVGQVKNAIVWGNHSETQHPDALTDGFCPSEQDGGQRIPLKSLLAHGDDADWARSGFVTAVQNRGKAVMEARGSSSALSAATATADCLKLWLVTGTAEGEAISMAVYNDRGYYGIQKGIVFSFPCECRNGEWSVKEGLELSGFARQRLEVTEGELLEEREAARELVGSTRNELSLSQGSSPPPILSKI